MCVHFRPCACRKEGGFSYGGSSCWDLGGKRGSHTVHRGAPSQLPLSLKNATGFGDGSQTVQGVEKPIKHHLGMRPGSKKDEEAGWRQARVTGRDCLANVASKQSRRRETEATIREEPLRSSHPQCGMSNSSQEGGGKII